MERVRPSVEHLYTVLKRSTLTVILEQSVLVQLETYPPLRRYQADSLLGLANPHPRPHQMSLRWADASQEIRQPALPFTDVHQTMHSAGHPQPVPGVHKWNEAGEGGIVPAPSVMEI